MKKRPETTGRFNHKIIHRLVAAQDRLANIPQHLMVQNAALGTSDQNCCTLIGNMTASVFQAFETHAIKYGLQVGDLLRR